MDRRSFMALCAGGGALLASGRLSADTVSESEDLLPSRGEFERLSLGMLTLEIGAEKPFSVLHISDTHLAAAYPDENERKVRLSKIRQRQFGGRQLDALRDAVAWARLHDEFIIHTGDLMDFQSRANCELAASFFGTSFRATVGNHEFTPEMWLSLEKDTKDEAWRMRSRAMLEKIFGEDFSFSSSVAHGINFVMLDDAYGTVTASQVERFREEVKKGLPIVLCMHIPFYSDSVARAMTHYWRRGGGLFQSAAIPDPSGDWLAQRSDPVTQKFIADLKREPLLKALLAGHLHFDWQETFSPTAKQYIVGGNYLFRGQEILFA